MINTKRELGQYYTKTNPFNNKYFKQWYNNITNYYDITEIEILEPFAGEKHIVEMMDAINDIKKPKNWKCFDISPSKNNTSKYNIIQQNTLKDFPQGYKIAITNPPYLSKNNATILNLEYDKKYLNLYLKCIDIMLNNVDFIAAIIPETFIHNKYYKERLSYAIILDFKMFDDTTIPVCLALFNKDISDDFLIVTNGNPIGYFNEINNKYNKSIASPINWKFNDSNWEIGLYACDSRKGEKIRFVKANELTHGKQITDKTRGNTKILGYSFKDDNELSIFINKLNENLNIFRDLTQDVLLSSFKELRYNENKYRKRLTYTLARNILNQTYIELYK